MLVLLGAARAQVVGMVGRSVPPPQPQGVPAVPAASGVVIGTVIAQDTQRPARFAQVQLQSVAQVQKSLQGNGGGGGGMFGLGGSISVRTDVDGTFEADNVTPGDYYVTATATGYVAERTLLQAQVAAGADPAALLAQLPQVHVTADATSSVTVPIERGGALAGHVEWEDGSAAAGVSVQAVPSTTAAALPAGLRGLGAGFGIAGSSENTDDKGNFRLSGLASGDYLVQVTISPGTQIRTDGRSGHYTSPIRVYAPGVFRKVDAKAVNVRAGDERTDVRLIVDLRGLHTVSGSAASSNPGDAVASGRVTLVDSSDASLMIQGEIGAGGIFRVPYVPKGSYTLHVSGASTQANGGFRGRGSQSSTTSAVTFQPFSQPLIVGDSDVSGVAVELTPVKAQP
jgi:hypothetical protein